MEDISSGHDFAFQRTSWRKVLPMTMWRLMARLWYLGMRVGTQLERKSAEIKATGQTWGMCQNQWYHFGVQGFDPQPHRRPKP